MKWLAPYLWRLILLVAGLASAILFLTLGFGKTILILLCCGLGLAVGYYEDKEFSAERLREYKWRIIFAGLGLASAIMFLTLGFGKTMLILLLGGVGFAVGLYKDKGSSPPSWLWFWRDKWQ